MSIPSDPRAFLYRALDPETATRLTADALSGAEDGELYLQYRKTEAFGFDDGRLKTASFDTQSGFGLRAVSGETTAFAHEGGNYGDVLLHVYDWLERRVDEVVTKGIDRARVLIDPGIGFGKSLQDNLALLNGLALFHGIGCGVVLGASRKRMIGALSNEAPAEARLGGSLAVAIKGAELGAQLIRVHDVFETAQALRIWRGMRDAALLAR